MIEPRLGTRIAFLIFIMITNGALAEPRFDFSFLDKAEFQAKYSEAAGKICFYVAGIRCQKCVRTLEGLVGSVKGLRRLNVEMGKSLVHVEIDPGQLSFSGIAKLIAEKGFSPIPLEKELDFGKAQKKEDRRDLIRLAIAGACAGNIMTFAFAVYSGASESIFLWLSFLLYLPVVSYVAWPFYLGAWRSLKQRQISIDLPMAIASFAGFGFSLIELARGKTDVYFDSLSGFLFLILISRFSQKRLQRGFFNEQELVEGLRMGRVRILKEGRWDWRALEALKLGDEFVLKRSETMPADGELLSPQGHFSLAWLTGEAKAKVFLKGAIIPAGARVMSAGARLIARRALSETGFGQILKQVQKFSLSRNRLVMVSDRWAQWLLGTVFVIALVFLAAYWSTSPEQAVQRALALIVVACPCAMAFGTPLALAVALKRARAAGLMVRDANLFEAVRKIKTIFLDKTGTLTESEVQLLETNPTPAFQKRIILSLENLSFHPIAFAFRNAFADMGAFEAVADLREVPGVGVSGRIRGKWYELKKSDDREGGTHCVLYEDGQILNRFQFTSSLKPTCLEDLETLRGRGFRLILLSGDSSEATSELGEALGFRPNEIHSSLSPIEKAAIVAHTPHAMMVGDGINDSLALMQAEVGVAVSGGVEAALKSAGIYLTEPGIGGVVSLFNVSEGAFALIRQNLTLSVAYNLAAGSLSLLGFINPFVAAILMPISSGILLLGTWLRRRT